MPSASACVCACLRLHSLCFAWSSAQLNEGGFSHKPAVADVHELLKGIVRCGRTYIRDEVEFRMCLPYEGSLAVVDSQRITQIILNGA
jgi:hypothetical protein